MEKKISADWNAGIGTGHRFSLRHSVNIGYMLNLKKSTDSLDKMLHILTTEYIYNL